MLGSKYSLYSDFSISTQTRHYFPFLKTILDSLFSKCCCRLSLFSFLAQLFESFFPPCHSLKFLSYFLWKYFSRAFAINPLKPPLSSSRITSLLNPISDLIFLDLLAAFDTVVSCIFLWKISLLDIKFFSGSSFAAVSQGCSMLFPQIPQFRIGVPKASGLVPRTFPIYVFFLGHHFQGPESKYCLHSNDPFVCIFT